MPRHSPYRYSPPYTGIEYNFLDTTQSKSALVTELIQDPKAIDQYGVRTLRLTFHNDEMEPKDVRLHVKTMLRVFIRYAELEEKGQIQPPPDEEDDSAFKIEG